MHDKNKAAPAEAAQQNTRANYKRFTAHGKSSSVPRKRRYRHGKQDYESLKASHERARDVKSRGRLPWR
jgi:hypothetical protein